MTLDVVEMPVLPLLNARGELGQIGMLTSVDLRSGAVRQIPPEQGADLFGLDVYTDATMIGVRAFQKGYELAAIDYASGTSLRWLIWGKIRSRI